MNLTQQQIENCQVDSDTIQSDINITQKEIDNYKEEIKWIQDNISQREVAIIELNKILEYRKSLIKE